MMYMAVHKHILSPLDGALLKHHVEYSYVFTSVLLSYIHSMRQLMCYGAGMTTTQSTMSLVFISSRELPVSIYLVDLSTLLGTLLMLRHSQ